ncbi:MAG: ABC transporter permease [Erysipelothrix sp.]|nr:ABC transporter permease [Erysipelothrix sp.]
MKDVIFLAQRMMIFGIPLLIVALAAVYSERSGVINIALEGIMIIGAFTGTLFIYFMQKNGLLSGYPLLIVAMLISTLSGMLFAAFHAFASINMSADQTISGTALNLFAPAIVIFVARAIVGVQQVPFKNEWRIREVPGLSKIPILGPMFFKNTYLTTLIGIIILVVTHYVLFHTKFGLRLRSAGENPHATDAAGISVQKMRYAGVLISGALGGLGGLIYIIPITTSFNGTVAGYGFLAMAVLIFGQWRPARIALAAFFFGLLQAVSAGYSGISFFKNLGIPQVYFEILPYVITLVVLIFTSKTSAAPKALGEIFDKGKR